MAGPVVVTDITKQFFGDRASQNKLFRIDWPDNDDGDALIDGVLFEGVVTDAPAPSPGRRFALPHGLAGTPTMCIVNPLFGDTLNAVLMDKFHTDVNPGQPPWDGDYIYIISANGGQTACGIVSVEWHHSTGR